MALPATLVWEVDAATGSDSNGGGYDPSVSSPGLDYTQGANQATFSYTDLVIGATTTQLTSVARAFVANDVGNTIQVSSGTGFTTGFYNVRSVAAGVATCDRSVGTAASTGGNAVLGGSIASPGMIGGIVIGGHVTFIKSGTYTATTTSFNVSNGLVNFVSGGGTTPISFIGYSTNRNQTNTDTQPIITTSVNLSNNFLFGQPSGSNNIHIYNMVFDGASKTGAGGVAVRSTCRVERCTFQNCTYYAGLAFLNGTSLAINCKATGNSCAGYTSGSFHTYINCEAYSNTAIGFDPNYSFSQSAMICINCYSYNNSGASSDGFGQNIQGIFDNCVSYGNGRDGFAVPNQFGGFTTFNNCLAEANTGVGYHTQSGSGFYKFINCGAYNNTGGIFTSGATPPAQLNIGFITNTTGTFFVNAAAGNFALNNTANQGALARAAGYPTTSPTGNTASHYDSGGSQHQDSGGTTTNIFPIFD